MNKTTKGFRAYLFTIVEQRLIRTNEKFLLLYALYFFFGIHEKRICSWASVVGARLTGSVALDRLTDPPEAASYAPCRCVERANILLGRKPLLFLIARIIY